MNGYLPIEPRHGWTRMSDGERLCVQAECDSSEVLNWDSNSYNHLETCRFIVTWCYYQRMVSVNKQLNIFTANPPDGKSFTYLWVGVDSIQTSTT